MRPNITRSKRFIFFTLYLSFICAGILMILSGPSLSLLAQHTGVTLPIAGLSFTAGSFGFSLGVFITGAVSNKFKAKYLLMAAVVIMSIAGLIIPLTHVFFVLLIAQSLLGMGFGSLDVSINLVASLVFQENTTETFNNLHSSYGVGALIGPLVLSLVLEFLHDITWAFLLGSIVGVISILLIIIMKLPVPTQKSKEQKPEQTIARSNIFSQPLVWLLALQLVLYVGAEVGFSNWIVTAISQSASISLALAAPAATMLWLGLTLGRMLSAQGLKRNVFTEYQLLYLCIIGGSISVAIAAIFSRQLIISFGASFLVGLFFGPLFPSITAIASRWFIYALGAISSILFISGGVGSMILPVLMGFLLPHIGVQWVLAIPSMVSLAIVLPLSLALHQRRILQLQSELHTMEQEPPVSSIVQK